MYFNKIQMKFKIYIVFLIININVKLKFFIIFIDFINHVIGVLNEDK